MAVANQVNPQCLVGTAKETARHIRSGVCHTPEKIESALAKWAQGDLQCRCPSLWTQEVLAAVLRHPFGAPAPGANAPNAAAGDPAAIAQCP